MKKLLLLSVCLFGMPVWAQRSDDCALSPLQNLIVNARGAEEVQTLIARGVLFDEQVRCGGTLTQLAIRRGNPDILEAILRQDRRRANAMVSLDAFPIQGAPKQVPLILFAAYYAPNKTIMDLLLAAGAKVSDTDDFGRNILWYLNKNPVLRNTELEDSINESLLLGTATMQEPDDKGKGASQQKKAQSAPSLELKRREEKKKSILDSAEEFLVGE